MNKKERKIILEDIKEYRLFVKLTIAFMILECFFIIFKEPVSNFLKHYGTFYDFLYYFYENLDINTIFSTQVMVATLMLTVVSIIAPSVNDRCLNISYKRIFFKPFIYEHNYITLAFNMIITIFISLIEFLFGLRIMQFFTLIITIYFLVQLVEMSYIIISKKSLVYIRLFNAIKNDKDDVLEICIDKIKNWQISKKGNIHNQYIIQELAILYLIENKSENAPNVTMICRECASKLIQGEKDYLEDQNGLDRKIKNTQLFDKCEDIEKYKYWLINLQSTN